MHMPFETSNSLRHPASATVNRSIGRCLWAIPEGYIPIDTLRSDDPRFASHETACMINTNDADANVTIMVYFSNREPTGPYHIKVGARRTLHLRFNDLAEPERIPRDTDYASVIASDIPIVVQHTRLDSRRSALALISTIAYAGD
jgi:hypothetical protein